VQVKDIKTYNRAVAVYPRQGGQMQITLAAWRTNAGYTQDRLAKELGYERKKVWNWENGVTAPTRPDLEMMARLFGCQPGDILLPEKRPLLPAKGQRKETK
jgi:transcriptional regulator with XRE-family HTH domain